MLRRSWPSILGLMDMCSAQKLVGNLPPCDRLTTGAEYQAVVEYAPIEKTPYKTKSKADPRQGTIEDGEIIPSVVCCLHR
jgi:hypothetical protein